MSDEPLSFLVWCKRDVSSNSSGASIIRVVRVDTGEEVTLKDGNYLLRLSADANAVRCLVRHMVSGSEVYIQSGQKLPDFVKTYLVQDSQPSSQAPETTGETAGESSAQDDDADETQA